MINKCKIHKIVLAIAVLICITGLGSVSYGVKAEQDFYDIKGHWSQKAIEPLIESGIIKGAPVNGVQEVMPDKEISRAEFVAIVVRAFGLKAVASNIKAFNDDKEGAWYMEPLRIASSNSLIAGYPDGGFHPADPVTNEQVSIILTRLRNQQLRSTGKTIDSSWYPVNVLNNARLEFDSMPADCFATKDNATRAETFTALYSFMKIVERESGMTAKTVTFTGPKVVGNSGTGNDPASVSNPSVTGSTGNTGGTATTVEPAKPGILGYDLAAGCGDIVYYQVYVYALNELGGFDFKISYDPGVLVATSVRSGSIKEGDYIKEGDADLSQAMEGSVLIKNMDTSAITGSDGTIFTIAFRVLPDATGSSAVTMTGSRGGMPILYNNDGSVISSVTCKNGKITVK